MVEQSKVISGQEFYTLFEAEAPVIASFTVGFALTTVHSNEEDAYLGGSGTLVTIDNRRGILTAEHVVRNLLDHGTPIGLILAQHGKSPIHRFFFTPDPAKCITFPNSDDSASGPDLGFIELDEEAASVIEARKSFYNLTRRRDRMLNHPPGSHLGAWYVSGMPSEWTRNEERSTKLRKVKEFRGMIGEVILSRAYLGNGFDYQVVDVQVEGSSQWPRDYSGYSGSGVWQILVKEADGNLCVTDRLLSAVVFFQSGGFEKAGKTIRELYCHGRQSIYGNLIDAARSNIG